MWRLIAAQFPWLISIAAACVGLTALVLGAWDTESLALIADRLAVDGEATQFPADRIDTIQDRTTLVGAFWLLLALVTALLWAFQRHALEKLFAAAPERVGAMARRIGRFFIEERAHAFLVATFTLASLALALGSADQPIRCDEGGTFLSWVSRPWYYAISLYKTNNHVLYSLLAQSTCGVLENKLLCVRLPALAAGVMIVPATYAAMRVHLGRSVALLAVAMISTSIYAVDFATNGRGYTMITLVFLLLLIVVPRLLDREAGPAWIAFVILSAIGFWTVPVMAYPFAIVLIWLLLGVTRELPRIRWATFSGRLLSALFAIGVLVLAFYSAIFAVNGPGTVTSNPVLLANQIGAPEILIHKFARLMRLVWKYWSYGQPQPVGFLLLIGCAVGTVFSRGAGTSFNRLLLATLSGGLSVLLVTRALPPSWIFLFLLPVYLGLAFAGLLGLGRALGRPGLAGRLALPLAIGIGVANSWAFVSTDDPKRVPWYVGYRDASEAAAYLIGVLQETDRVSAHNVEKSPLAYYLKQEGTSDPYSWTRLEADLGSVVYFIDSPRSETRARLNQLRQRGFSRTEVVKTLDNSRILRLTRPAGT